MSDSLHVAFVTPEMAPFVKTGGLADISAALPKALVRLGHRVTVVLPRYASIAVPAGRVRGLRPRARGRDPAQRRLLPHPDARPASRSCSSSTRRSSTAPCSTATTRTTACASPSSPAPPSSTSAAGASGPSVFHAHDWQTGLVPVYLKAFYWDDPTLHRMPSVFTIHNVAYQGQFGHGHARRSWACPGTSAPRTRLEYHGSISYLKGGTRVLGARQHRVPDLRPRDPGARARLRLRRRRALARRRPRRGS